MLAAVKAATGDGSCEPTPERHAEIVRSPVLRGKT
jgi:hypothetical protein